MTEHSEFDGAITPVSPSFRAGWAKKRLSSGKPLLVEGVDIVMARLHGREFCFATTHDRDPIQRKWRKGQFYEPLELEQLRHHFPLGGTFVDIGANVGNHSLFVAGFLCPSKIIPFEPNPAALKLYMTNMALNGFQSVTDMRFLGFGLSDAEAGGFSVDLQPRNLGGTRMRADERGRLSVMTGDAALADVKPDLIKIDVEGMEMQVLSGLDATFARARPTLFIEVDDQHVEAFRAWAAERDYEVVEEVRRYANNTNFILRPSGSDGA